MFEDAKFKNGHKCHNSQASKNWLSNSLPVSSRASLPGHRQCLHLCFSCKEYVFCFVLFRSFLVFFLTLWYRLLLPGAHERHGCGCLCRQTSKAWPWTVFDVQINKKKLFYPFSSSESTLAPLRRSKVSSSWHPELGGALGPKFYISFGGKGKTSEPIFVQRNCFKIQDCQKHPAGDPPCGKV